MDRNIVYPGAIPLDTDILTLQRSVMTAVGFLAQATLGTSTVADGLICTAQTVPNMTVNISPGSILALSTVDATAFGSLAADTVDPLVKIGINPSVVVSTALGTIAAPTTTGQSINYLIEAAFQESDATPVVLPYYNSSNPAVAYSGPANSGAAQNTQRLQRVNLQLKAGSPATTGSQVTPTPDSGFVGLWVITVAYAQTTIVAGNIVKFTGAPFVDPNAVGRGVQPGRLLNIQVFNTAGSFTYTPTPGTNTIDGDIIAGGGGGGATTTTGAGTVSSGGGGGSGARAKFKVANPTATTVTIGAGGTGGTAGGGTGGSGGTSSFGSLASVTGGAGGNGGVATAGPTFSSPGGGGATITGSAVYFSRKGDVGGAASIYSASANISGAGASSLYGAGGGPTGILGTGGNVGLPASGNGAGGAGSGIGVSQTGLAGGAGSPGFCIIYEYS